MHHKYFIIDGDEVWSGSYNLSVNAEHNTFENIVRLSGPEHASVVAAFRDNFESIWDTGRPEDLLADLSQEIVDDPVIPIVFDSMALTWQEVNDLKVLIRSNCPAVDSTEFRTNAAAHRVCPK